MTEPQETIQAPPPPQAESNTTTAAIIIAAFRYDCWIERCLDRFIASIDERHHIYLVDNRESNGTVSESLSFANNIVMETGHTLEIGHSPTTAHCSGSASTKPNAGKDALNPGNQALLKFWHRKTDRWRSQRLK